MGKNLLAKTALIPVHTNSVQIDNTFI